MDEITLYQENVQALLDKLTLETTKCGAPSYQELSELLALHSKALVNCMKSIRLLMDVVDLCPSCRDARAVLVEEER